MVCYQSFVGMGTAASGRLSGLRIDTLIANILVLFSFVMNVNEQRIIAFLTEKCCYLNL